MFLPGKVARSISRIATAGARSRCDSVETKCNVYKTKQKRYHAFYRLFCHVSSHMRQLPTAASSEPVVKQHSGSMPCIWYTLRGSLVGCLERSGENNLCFLWLYSRLRTALLERCKHQIDLFTCTLGISACEKAAEWQQALILFEDIKVLRFEPNIVSYGAMLLGPESESKKKNRCSWLFVCLLAHFFKTSKHLTYENMYIYIYISFFEI